MTTPQCLNGVRRSDAPAPHPTPTRPEPTPEERFAARLERVELMRTLPMRTPAYVVDEAALAASLDIADDLRERSGCRVLFATKSYSFQPTIDLMTPRLDGLAVSSAFEARAAEGALRGDDMTLHFTQPGLRRDDARSLAQWCTHIAYNTEEQYIARGTDAAGIAHQGLRVNTGLSFADDPRYDPCRDHSRLGEPVANAARALDRHPGLRGLLIHTNCESTDYSQLAANLGVLIARLGARLSGDRLKWVNLGGGYLFRDHDDNPVDREPLLDVVRYLREQGLEVFIEPGAALIRDAGNLVAGVLEVQERGGRRIAVLDTTVNHLPEVYEYQFTPYVYGQLDDFDPYNDGPRGDDHGGDVPPDEADGHEYILAGSTCLAGDVLGTYRFAEPLRPGDRVVVGYVGAYNLVKAHTFNGVNLPDVCHLDPDGGLAYLKQYTYEDYARRWEGKRNA